MWAIAQCVIEVMLAILKVMIEAVIFDMDGLLIDSEPLWKQAETEVFNKIGVPLTREEALQTTGMRTDEMVQYWHQRYQWRGTSAKEVQERIEHRVLELIQRHGNAKDGVDHAIKLCEELGLPMAVASSSAMPIVCAVIEKLGIKHKLEIMHSAEFETHGKPHPAVYISAARKLKITPGACLAFEDSVNGAISAKAAKMHCIAIPEAHMVGDKRYGIADIVLNSLRDVTPQMVKAL
jgi:sugar-phosphatase